MTNATKTLLEAIEKFNTEGLSELLFDNKSEVACNQRLCAAINKDESNKYLARVEYTNKDDSVSRADLVIINRETGRVDLCAEAKTLTATNVMYPTKGEKKKTNKENPDKGYHPFFDNMKKNIDQQKFKKDKFAIMWIYGWEKLPKDPKPHLKEKYCSLRSRIKKRGEFKKKEVKEEIKDVFNKLGLSEIQQKKYDAEDTHEGYKAYLIVTIGRLK